MARLVRLSSFDQMTAELDGIERLPDRPMDGAWTMHQVLVHIAQGIEYSITGYPRMRSTLFRKTIGRIALRKFLGQGQMSHDLAAPIPGAPPLAADGTTADGLARLRKAIADFRSLPGDPAPHFAYGPLSKSEYESIHAMHLANHLSLLRLDAAP